MTNRRTASVEDAFERALGAILARVSVSVPRMAIALSGGLDSSALLHLAHAYSQRIRIELFAFHVHHGLSENADGWLAHCERECARLGIRFDRSRVDVRMLGRDGIEQAARKQRYAALGELCRQHDVPLLLTAHHRDDQVETVLLQLLRGAGLAGLSGMALANEAQDLLGGLSPMMARPLLAQTRVDLEEYVARRGIAYIEDESNDDVRYSRNALRHVITPVLERHFPGYQQCVTRAAHHAQSAQRLLSELAAMDLRNCADGDGIIIAQLEKLDEDRQCNMLRFWFTQHGVRMPSMAWIDELCLQLFGARDDAQVCVVHPDCEVRRHRGRAFLLPRARENVSSGESCSFRWAGEACRHFPMFGGSLYFDTEEVGIAEEWLMGRELTIRYRQGGEKLKFAPGRPSRSLKHHYQELDIPAWERQRLPVLLAGAHLLYAAGIGLNWKSLPEGSGRRFQLRWEKDTV